jgi:hypothetical protein
MPKAANKNKVFISDAAYKLLLEKSMESKESIHEVADAMIMEFTPSTPEERDKVTSVYFEAREQFMSLFPDATLKQIWRNGYLTGWKMFQLRKTKSMFKKYKKRIMG